MNYDLLLRSFGFHGPELVHQFICEQGTGSLQGINLSSVDYTSYELRKVHIRAEECKRRVEICKFIAKKADLLFKMNRRVNETKIDDDYECYAVPPPIEHFMVVPEAERRQYFMKTVRKYDVVTALISGKQDNGLSLSLICLDGPRSRYIDDLQIKAFCPVNHIERSSSHEDPLDSYQLKDMIRTVIIGVDGRLTTSMLRCDNPVHDLNLGLVTDEDLPPNYKICRQTNDKSYEQTLESIHQFNNPSSVSHLYEVTGLVDIRPHVSLTRQLSCRVYGEDEYASRLRSIQSSAWANKSVRQAICHLKKDENVEAFQLLSKALQIDADNVEALVARGALYANSSNFTGALADFEKALKIDPNHTNGVNYAAETLIALGKRYESKGDIDRALGSYKKALDIKKNCVDAQRALSSLELEQVGKKRMNTKDDPRPTAVVNPSSVNVAKQSAVDKLKFLLHEEKKSKKRRRRSSDSSSEEEEESSGEVTVGAKSPRRRRSQSGRTSSSSDHRNRSSKRIATSDDDNGRSRRKHSKRRGDSSRSRSRSSKRRQSDESLSPDDRSSKHRRSSSRGEPSSDDESGCGGSAKHKYSKRHSEASLSDGGSRGRSSPDDRRRRSSKRRRSKKGEESRSSSETRENYGASKRRRSKVRETSSSGEDSSRSGISKKSRRGRNLYTRGDGSNSSKHRKSSSSRRLSDSKGDSVAVHSGFEFLKSFTNRYDPTRDVAKRNSQNGTSTKFPDSRSSEKDVGKRSTSTRRDSGSDHSCGRRRGSQSQPTEVDSNVQAKKETKKSDCQKTVKEMEEFLLMLKTKKSKGGAT